MEFIRRYIMNKPVELLYDEYIESYDPKAMLSKLKKSELIELLMYATDDVQRTESCALLEEENQELTERLEYIHEECIDIDNLKQWMECRTNDIVIELLPKLLDQYVREMNQAKQLQDKKMYA
jgi:hypothetical protein